MARRRGRRREAGRGADGGARRREAEAADIDGDGPISGGGPTAAAAAGGSSPRPVAAAAAALALALAAGATTAPASASSSASPWELASAASSSSALEALRFADWGSGGGVFDGVGGDGEGPAGGPLLGGGRNRSAAASATAAGRRRTDAAAGGAAPARAPSAAAADPRGNGTRPSSSVPSFDDDVGGAAASVSADPARAAAAAALPAWYNLSLSTERNHAAKFAPASASASSSSSGILGFAGPYASIRSTLDYGYHGHYAPYRQALQDDVVSSMLNRTTVVDAVTGEVCEGGRPSEPWIVFTAGAMGAGKTHTIRRLSSRSLFPLSSFVSVDPDEVRRHLPEFEHYVRTVPRRAGELTRKEAGYVSEILTTAALREGRNVLVDGSLRDAEWYGGYFGRLREEYGGGGNGNGGGLKIAILHVTAPREAVFKRAEDRSRVTGRVVPRETLESALEAVPRSVNTLAPLADFFCELHNGPGPDPGPGTGPDPDPSGRSRSPKSTQSSGEEEEEEGGARRAHADGEGGGGGEGGGEVELRTEGVTADAFRAVWEQRCAEEPTTTAAAASAGAGEEREREREPAARTKGRKDDREG